MIRHKGLSWGLVFLWMGLIFMFSHQSAEISADLSGSLLAYVIVLIERVVLLSQNTAEILHALIRKLAHFLIYFILGVLLYRAFLSTSISPRVRWFQIGKNAVIVGMFYAFTDEVHQLFVVGRSGQFRDILIDSCGVLCGVLVYYKVKFKIIREN